jgi:hypothetical protein
MIDVKITPPAIVPQLLTPVPLVGSGKQMLINSKPVCLLGDELPPAIAGPLSYTAPPFVTPGIGMLTVILDPKAFTSQAISLKPMLVGGTPFSVAFNVATPATMPTPGGPVPDPVLVKPGTAMFVTGNTISAQ